MKKTKAQSAIEFMILIGAVLAFFLAFLFVFQQNVSQEAVEKRNLAIQEVALTAQNELNIAAKATDGYSREFFLPNTIQGLNYNITLEENLVYVVTENTEYALALPGQNATGNFVKGDNTIRKQNSTIFLNS